MKVHSTLAMDPVELIEYILLSGKTSPKDLRSSALVSRAWCYVARKLQFKSTRASPSKHPALLRVLSSPTTTIAPHVRDLVINGQAKSYLQTPHLVLAILLRLPHLTTLKLRHLLWHIDPDDLKDTRPRRRFRLKRLEIRDVKFISRSDDSNTCFEAFDHFFYHLSQVDTLSLDEVQVKLKRLDISPNPIFVRPEPSKLPDYLIAQELSLGPNISKRVIQVLQNSGNQELHTISVKEQNIGQIQLVVNAFANSLRTLRLVEVTPGIVITDIRFKPFTKGASSPKYELLYFRSIQCVQRQSRSHRVQES